MILRSKDRYTAQAELVEKVNNSLPSINPNTNAKEVSATLNELFLNNIIKKKKEDPILIR